jgi:polyhydroxyalkanoate synthesis repressor PhaR
MENELIQSVDVKSKAKYVIKKYDNRKLYDTKRSAYVTLDDLAKMVRSNQDFIVVENKTKIDITALTLMQIAFENEKRAPEYMPIPTLREIIQKSGSISKYLLKFGLFTQEQMLVQEKQKPKVENQMGNYFNPISTFESEPQQQLIQAEPTHSKILIKTEDALPSGIVAGNNRTINSEGSTT